MDKIITHSKLQVTTFNNRELNDLGKIICLKKKNPKKLKFLLKEFQFVMLLKNRRRMAYSLPFSYINDVINVFRSNYNVILTSK